MMMTYRIVMYPGKLQLTWPACMCVWVIRVWFLLKPLISGGIEKSIWPKLLYFTRNVQSHWVGECLVLEGIIFIDYQSVIINEFEFWLILMNTLHVSCNNHHNISSAVCLFIYVYSDKSAKNKVLTVVVKCTKERCNACISICVMRHLSPKNVIQTTNYNKYWAMFQLLYERKKNGKKMNWRLRTYNCLVVVLLCTLHAPEKTTIACVENVPFRNTFWCVLYFLGSEVDLTANICKEDYMRTLRKQVLKTLGISLFVLFYFICNIMYLCSSWVGLLWIFQLKLELKLNLGTIYFE